MDSYPNWLSLRLFFTNNKIGYNGYTPPTDLPAQETMKIRGAKKSIGSYLTFSRSRSLLRGCEEGGDTPGEGETRERELGFLIRRSSTTDTWSEDKRSEEREALMLIVLLVTRPKFLEAQINVMPVVYLCIFGVDFKVEASRPLHLPVVLTRKGF
jgi:hypothetical protein